MKDTLGIYVRQSVDKATDNSIEDQILKGIEYAKGSNLDYILYVDRGKSAYKEDFSNRPEMQRLLDDIEALKIQKVFAYDMSRLSRNATTNSMLAVIFQKYKVKVATVLEDEIDFSNALELLVSQIRGYGNMIFVENSAAKIRSVLKNNVIKGKAHTGVIKPFGYTSSEDGMLTVETDEAEIIKDIFSYCISGMGTKAISSKLNERGIATKTQRLILNKKLGLPEGSTYNTKNINSFKKWAPNTILSILKNPLYKGKRLYKGELYDCPSIISDEVWDSAQAQIKRNTNSPGTNKYNYLLKNLITCVRCGSNFCGRTRQSKKDHYYRCASKINGKGSCGNRSINIDIIESLIWMVVAKSDILISEAKREADKLKNPALLSELNKQRENLEKRRINLHDGRKNLLELVINQIVTNQEAEIQLKDSEEKINLIIKEVKEIDLKINSQLEIDRNISYAASFLND